jgi:hypothetical protein
MDGYPCLNLQVNIYPLCNGGFYFRNGFLIPNGLNKWIRISLGVVDFRFWWVGKVQL